MIRLQRRIRRRPWSKFGTRPRSRLVCLRYLLLCSVHRAQRQRLRPGAAEASGAFETGRDSASHGAPNRTWGGISRTELRWVSRVQAGLGEAVRGGANPDTPGSRASSEPPDYSPASRAAIKSWMEYYGPDQSRSPDPFHPRINNFSMASYKRHCAEESGERGDTISASLYVIHAR